LGCGICRFHAESDEDSENEDDLFGTEGGGAGEVVDEEEDQQLNPYRTAYESGYARAMEPEPEPGREVLP
jgi:hypothetical protein